MATSEMEIEVLVHLKTALVLLAKAALSEGRLVLQVIISFKPM